MRQLIDTFDHKFLELNRRTLELLNSADEGSLHSLRTADGRSAADLIIRSAGAVEQMIGGITRRLWDDPFEWTLPERMQTVELIFSYVEEVEISRLSGFQFLKDDADLTKSLPAPVEMKMLGKVLSDTLVQAETHLAKALSLLSSELD